LGISCPHMVCGSYFLNILPTISHENETQKVTLIAAIVTTSVNFKFARFYLTFLFFWANILLLQSKRRKNGE